MIADERKQMIKKELIKLIELLWSYGAFDFEGCSPEEALFIKSLIARIGIIL